MRFRVVGRTAGGAVGEGVLRAPSREAAIKAMVAGGYSPEEVEPLGLFANLLATLRSLFGGASASEQAVFCRQLSTMSISAVPLARAFEVLAKPGASQQYAPVSAFLVEGLLRGKPPSALMALFPRHFSPTFCCLVRVGETTGLLSQCLERAANLMEKEDALRKQTRSALVYPAFVFGCFFLLALACGLFVLPRFADMLASLQVEPPAVFRLLFAVTSALARPSVLLLLLQAVALALLTVPLLHQVPAVRERVDAWMMRVPPLRNFIIKQALVRLSFTLELLLDSGVSVREALRLASETASNREVANVLRHAEAAIVHGASLSEALAQQNAIPQGFSSLLSMAEETGKYSAALQSLNQLYQEELDNTVRTLLSLLEPIVIVCMGLMVGAFLLCMMIPMAQVLRSLA